MKNSTFKFAINKPLIDNNLRQLNKNHSQQQMIIQDKNDILEENDENQNYKIYSKNYEHQSNLKNKNYKNILSIRNNQHSKGYYYTFSEKEKKNYQFNNKMKIPKGNRKSQPEDRISKKYFKNSYGSLNEEHIILKEKSLNKKEKIPKVISFRQNSFSGKENIDSNISINRESYSELIEIPKSEYASLGGKEILFVGDGMETGEYKFKGAQVILTADLNQNQKINLDEEEIFKEIMRRKNKSKKQKKVRYEVLDKFCVRTEFNGKPIKKIQKQIQYEQGNSNEFYKSKKNKNINNSFNYGNCQIKESKREWKKIMNYNLKNNNIEENCRYNDIISLPFDNYSLYLFNKINRIRNNPSSYIKTIEKEKNNIIIDGYGRIIYNGKIKVALNQGIAAFDDAINSLRNTAPMEKLEFSQLMTIESPKNENDIKSIEFMKYHVENLINNGINIKSYWREIINEPEVCFLLMIIDDNGSKSGMRRSDILNPNMKYIGITSYEINGNFACFITLRE